MNQSAAKTYLSEHRCGECNRLFPKKYKDLPEEAKKASRDRVKVSIQRAKAREESKKQAILKAAEAKKIAAEAAAAEAAEAAAAAEAILLSDAKKKSRKSKKEAPQDA